VGNSRARIDVLIVGGGIAGLWLLDELHRCGYATLLITKGNLGQGQSIAAQGIIHGGTKYFGETSVADLAAMPERWRASLAGDTGPDLSTASPLATAMQMWLPPQLGGGLLAGFSQKAMRGRMREAPKDTWPNCVAGATGGHLFELDEIVVDVPAILTALHAAHADRIRQIPDDCAFEVTSNGRQGAVIGIDDYEIETQFFVFAAGAGNDELLRGAGMKQLQGQSRPLHQVMISGMKTPLYIHCVGKNPKPLATITSYPDGQGRHFWYVGGLLAEQGIEQTPDALIRTAKQELARLLPGADFTGTGWATHAVNRAEPAHRGGLRPTSATAKSFGSGIVAWPTKLALAPVLADKVLEILRQAELEPGPQELGGLVDLPRPAIARPPWQEVGQWS
jgi:glycine/D-amino acid oxidase-like deaminating enzyme